jgi:hypothetical protein
MVSTLIIGFKGEVGSAIYELSKKAGYETYGVDLKVKDTIPDGNKIDFMHICLVQVTKETLEKTISDFVALCKGIIETYKPEHVVMHTSVVPRTTEAFRSFFPSIAYSPVRGQHNFLFGDMCRYPKHFTPLQSKDYPIFEEHMVGMFPNFVGHIGDPAELELAKILDVTMYFAQIAFCQEQERVLQHYGFRFDNLLKGYQNDHNKIYPDKRPCMFPSYGGGHCVRQDAELVLLCYNSPMIRAFLESNCRFLIEHPLVKQ